VPEASLARAVDHEYRHKLYVCPQERGRGEGEGEKERGEIRGCISLFIFIYSLYLDIVR
jgi:hypothetical protein